MMDQRLAALEKNYKQVNRSIKTINTRLDAVEIFADTRFNTIDTRIKANEMHLNKTTKFFQKRLDNLDVRLNQLCDNVDAILMMLKQAEVKNKNIKSM
ncbi:unnamed protein product [Rotaria sp. Silwood2]|nr:unnamed protein product [Rotaria sp. Silwood2]CAF3083680.1 unnamed protein product [Rotaria sp. Silwood2]CAF3295893.1 unnamed protein product [Rotaria sp. Silwood2]CAF3592746.1 unnamed protein product [Rotaria sp. Silwood2]CAF4110270.1 unnamed protein product [Rotaria sp. Silwood2]